MTELFSLGSLYPSDFLKPGEPPRTGKHELKLIMLEDRTGTVRLESTAPQNMLFGKYFYRSGINEFMRRQLLDIVTSILPLIETDDEDIWLDVASNDGTLLSFVPPTFTAIGIDPAEDNFKKEAEKHADLIIQDFFSADVFKKSKYGDRKCKVITCIAMFYDVPNPNEFLQDIHEILDDEGLFVIQFSHAGLMIDQCAFDNILHEHIFYYTLNSLTTLLERNGFKVVDCQLNDTNGGSFRVYIRKQKANDKLFASRPYRDVCKYRIESLCRYERSRYFTSPSVWWEFFEEINARKEQTVKFINQVKSKGKSVWGYGASTKGNTLLQYFELDNTLITAIADRNEYKWGLQTVATNIPIVSEDEMRKANPDYLLIFPWHFISTFIEREKKYLSNGGSFIVPCPEFEII